MRSQKYYRKNEKKIMRDLGFEPTIGSGSGWLEKEDGQTDYTIAQLKSTDKSSIGISLLDMQTLEHNGMVTHKRPVFVIQFLKTNDIFLVIRPDQDILNLLHSDLASEKFELGEPQEINESSIKRIKPADTSRQKFYEDREVTRNEQNKAKRKVRRSQGKEKPKRRLEPELPI